MLQNIKSTNKLKQAINNILKEELILCDNFDTLVEAGKIDMVALNKVRFMSGHLNLYKNEIVKLTKEEIMQNPYLSNIKVPNVSLNRFRLSNDRHIYNGTVAKYGFKTRDLLTMKQHNSYFVCDKTLHLPCLVENNNSTCWMSAEPFEFNSFKKFINEAKGNVLLIGCGIGYVAYMLSRKNDVKSITIIDSNDDVLELFFNYILPQFEHTEKIMTINGDGIEYLKEGNLDKYDYINVDIWYDVYDMIYPYLECLEIEKANPNVHFSYWLEEELKTCIQKSILGSIGDFKNTNFLTDKIGDDIVKKSKPHTYQDIYNLVNIQDIRKFLYTWFLKHKNVVQEYRKKDMDFIENNQKALNNFFSKSNGHMKSKFMNGKK